MVDRGWNIERYAPHDTIVQRVATLYLSRANLIIHFESVKLLLFRFVLFSQIGYDFVNLSGGIHQLTSQS